MHIPGSRIPVYMDDPKASCEGLEKAMQVHETVKRYAASVGMVVNKKKCAIQLKVETPLPETLQDITRLDEVTFK